MSTTAVSTRTASKRNLPFQPWAKPAPPPASLPWTRPTAWLALPDISSQQRAAGLVRIDEDGNFLAVTAAGAYTVDWGDGTTTNHNSGTTAYKEYNYADIADTGESELGYRQVIVQIYPQTGQNLTNLNFNVRHNRAGLNTTYIAGWLDLWVNCPNLTALTIGASTNPVCNKLQSVRVGTTACSVYSNLFVNLSALAVVDVADTSVSLTSTNSMFSACGSLTDVSLFNTASVTDMTAMFNNCRSLLTVPLFNTANVLFMDSVFNNCSALTAVPLFDTSKALQMTNMFSGCGSLTDVPLFDTSKIVFMTGAFTACFSLQTVPLFNTANVTSMSGVFANCVSLQTVPLFNTANVTNMASMFNGCVSLQTVPLFNTSKVTTMGSMFSNCPSLTDVPLFNTALVTDMNGMFNTCRSLTAVPLFNTANVTNMSSMFANCVSLQTVPLFNTANVTNMGTMFNGCVSLQTVPLFNTANVTNMASMFNGCVSLQTVPLFNTSKVTTMGGMFISCLSLKTVPLFDTANVTTITTMFNGCAALTDVPLFDTAKVPAMGNMFFNCVSLQTVPLFNTANVTSMTSMFSNCRNLSVIPAFNCNAITANNSQLTFIPPSVSVVNLLNIRTTISFTGCKLSAAEIAKICTNLTAGISSRTLTLTGNYGLDLVNRAGYNTTAGSTTVTQINTTGLATGMLVSGAAVSGNRSVTFQAAGNTVTRTAHGLTDGDRVSFVTITSTTGIVINIPYFVVNATADTFQVSDTEGGAARALTTNGNGNMISPNYITGITANTSITLSLPAITTTSNQTFVATAADYSLAQLKGYAVTT